MQRRLGDPVLQLSSLYSRGRQGGRVANPKWLHNTSSQVCQSVTWAPAPRSRCLCPHSPGSVFVSSSGDRGWLPGCQPEIWACPREGKALGSRGTTNCILVGPSALLRSSCYTQPPPGRRLLTRFPMQNFVGEVQTQPTHHSLNLYANQHHNE